MTARERAALVLEICSHELRNVAQYDKGTIELAIQAQIEEESRDVLQRYSKTADVEKEFKQALKNVDLLKVRKRSKN